MLFHTHSFNLVMGEEPKELSRWFWGGMSLAALIAYSVEFAADQGTPHAGQDGFIAMFSLIIIFCIVGIVGAILGEFIMAVIFLVCMTPLVVCDAHYIGAFYAFVIGQLACAFCMAYAINGPK